MHAPVPAHLPHFVVAHGVAAFRRLGVPIDDALERSPGPWVAWSDVAKLLNELEPRLDDDAPRRFADLYVSGHPVLRLVESLGLSARGLAQLVARANAVSPQLYGESVHEFRGQLLRFRVRQHQVLTPCALWWKLWAAVFTAAPQAIGQPSLLLRACTLDALGLDATWELPEARAPRIHGWSSHVREVLALYVPLLADLDTVDDHLGTQADEATRLHVDHGLTPSESRVALHIADGLTPREAAAELGISYETVRTHLRNLYEALDLSSQRELTHFIERWRRTG